MMMETALSFVLESSWVDVTVGFWEPCDASKANRRRMLCYSMTTGETAINRQRDDLCLRHDPDPGGWSPDFSLSSAMPGFRLLCSSSTTSSARIWTRKPLSSLRSAPCMICMPLPRRKCSDDDPAFLCHVPAALSSFALCSLAWTRLPRRNGGLDSTSLHLLEHKHQV